MNIEDILNEVKNLSEKDIIKFNTEFNKIYKPIADANKKKKAEIHKKKEDDNMAKAIEIGNKICERAGLKGFPFSCISKHDYYPYETWIRDEFVWEDVCDYLEDIDVPELWEDIDPLIDEFDKLIPYKYKFSYKDEDYYKESDTAHYKFFMKGGEIKEVDEEEFYENLID